MPPYTPTPTDPAARPHAFVVVMAGGSGTRFWPLSRSLRPKQLLPIGVGGETLLQATVRRASRLVPPEHILVVTAERLGEATAAQLPQVPRHNLLLEPIGRNTAACIGWAAAHVQRRDPEGVLAVLPADPHIGNEDAFARLLARCLDAAQGERLVTLGVRPTRPETGYGYLEVGEALEPGVHRVARFVEKPDRATAERMVAARTFLWNSGMFFYRAAAIRSAIDACLPALAQGLARLDAAAAQGREAQAVAEGYGQLPSISIDHGVMERARDVVVVPGDELGWTDVGSWTSAWELAAKDAEGNALPDAAIAVDASNCYARAPEGKVVALIGVEDLVVVDTEDALLVMPRDRAQDVRRVVDALKARRDEDHL